MSHKKVKKNDSSSSRVSLSDGKTPSKESASLLVVSSERLGSQWRCQFPIWPEWSDADVNKEKWDSSRGPEHGKTKDKNLHAPYYDDPEGKIHLPPSLNVHSWKRPSEFLDTKSPTIVESESTFDLISANDHLTGSEVMRWIISEICILWAVCNSASTEGGGWRPWEHIYSLCKAEKGHVPLYNSFGKYVVRIYWMGCWRKVTVDDSMPFDEQNNLLLPASTCQSELWTMLLAKALIKVANTNVVSQLGGEIGELSFIHTLTGWIPEIIPIKSMHLHKVWDFLRDSIPMFKHSDENFQEKVSQSSHTSTRRSSVISCKSKHQESDESQGTAEKVVCAGFYPFQLLNDKPHVFGEMANSSEVLRHYGCSLLFSHIVLLTKTRACKLKAPPQPPPVPRWKLIRPRKEIRITDEPQKPPLSKPEQFIEVASLFLSHHIKSSIDPGPELEVNQSTQWQQYLESIGESKSPECQEDLDHAASETSTSSATSTDKTEVTAKDRDDICTAHGSVVSKQSTTPKLSTPLKPMLHKTWVDLGDFTKCFQNLLVFHKSQSYQHHFQKSHFKNTILSKMTSVISSTGETTSSSTTGSCSVSSAVSSPQCAEERGAYFLCVDSLQPSQILIHFSALLGWGKTAEEKNDVKAISRSAVLHAQPYSWKTMQCQLSLLTIKTTSSKAAMLTLCPGRHVLCIHTKAALGYNLRLYSTTPFICGDEETIMSHVTKESMQFIEQASSILGAMTRVVYNFSDEKELPAARRALEEAYCPRSITNTVEKWQHHRVFNKAVYHMLRKALDRKLVADERFALVALTADPSLFTFDPREDAHTSDEEPKCAESWRNKQLTEKEIQAITLLQAGFKGCFVRKILNASQPGTKQNIRASDILLNMWSHVESDAEEQAISLLRNIIEHSKRKEQLYDCQQDEWTKIAVAEYSVSLQEQTASSWALVFREAFLVPQEMMLVPKVYSSIPSCSLHVIDNDTGEEMHKIFGYVAPHVYQPNKLGYTLVAEAVISEAPPLDCKWKMCLIGTREPLPKLICESPLNKFSVKELRDYYVPNEKTRINLICRYSVQMTEDCLVTLQFQTSKPDVLIRLSVLDQEKEVKSHTGKGHVVIPVCYLLANQAPSCIAEENKSQKESPSQDNCVKMAAAPHQHDMENNTSGKPDSWSDQHRSSTETMIHKYVVQAEVLYKSWLLDAAQLDFVHMLRDLEKNEIKEPEATTNDGQKMNKSSRDSEGEKTKGKQRTRSKSNTSPEMSFDLTKPHWILRVVSDKSQAESIKIKKDTERMDQIRAIKEAWETAEPGRAAKALQARLRFLHKVQHQASDDKTTAGEEAASSPSKLELTNAPCPPMDYTPFIRQHKDFPVLKDLHIEEAQKKERLEKIQAWQLVRDTVLEHRAQEALNRQQLRKYQLDLYSKKEHKNA
ncbi:androglobin [Thalassophryne amazonica]|uniref:androglobin n=1 Tax=Thalassophryne amazonica TaxID=390379 RepID=UPI001471E25A|nr:androglobin [Thalassophryne amazonica]